MRQESRTWRRGAGFGSVSATGRTRISPVPGQRARRRWTGRGLTRDRHPVPYGPLLDLEKSKSRHRAGLGPHAVPVRPWKDHDQSTHETRRPAKDQCRTCNAPTWVPRNDMGCSMGCECLSGLIRVPDCVSIVSRYGHTETPISPYRGHVLVLLCRHDRGGQAMPRYPPAMPQASIGALVERESGQMSMQGCCAKRCKWRHRLVVGPAGRADGKGVKGSRPTQAARGRRLPFLVRGHPAHAWNRWRDPAPGTSSWQKPMTTRRRWRK